MEPSHQAASHQKNQHILKPTDLFFYRHDDTAFWLTPPPADQNGRGNGGFQFWVCALQRFFLGKDPRQSPLQQNAWLMPPADQKDEPAELQQATWLEVTGAVEKTHPLKKYQVGFLVSLKPDASGWDDTPVCVMAKRGEKGQYTWKIVNLSQRKANEQFVIPENFVLDEDPLASDRKLYFGLHETWNGNWKKGLLIHQAFVKEQPFVEKQDSGKSAQEAGCTTSNKSVEDQDSTEKSTQDAGCTTSNKSVEDQDSTGKSTQEAGCTISNKSVEDQDSTGKSTQDAGCTTSNKSVEDQDSTGKSTQEAGCTISNKSVEDQDSTGKSTQEAGCTTSNKSVEDQDSTGKSTQEEGTSEKSVEEDSGPKPKLNPSTTTIVYPEDLTIPNNEGGTIWKIPLVGQGLDRHEPAELLRNDQGIQISCMVEVDPLKTYRVGFKLSAPDAVAVGGGASSAPPYPLSNLDIGAQRGENGPLFESWLGDIFALGANEQRSVPADLVLSPDPHATSNRLYLSIKSRKDVQKGGLLLHHAFAEEVNTEWNYLEGNERIIPGQDFDFGNLKSSWDIPPLQEVQTIRVRQGRMHVVTERTGDILPVTAKRLSDVYVSYKFKIERRHTRYHIGYKVSFTSDAFGWDGAKFCFQALFGGDGLSHWATSSRVMTLPRNIKANRPFNIPENFVFYQNRYPPDVKGQEYDVLMTMRVLPSRDRLGNVLYRGGLRIHHMFIKELIPIGK